MLTGWIITSYYVQVVVRVIFDRAEHRGPQRYQCRVTADARNFQDGLPPTNKIQPGISVARDGGIENLHIVKNGP